MLFRKEYFEWNISIDFDSIENGVKNAILLLLNSNALVVGEQKLYAFQFLDELVGF